MSEEVRRRRRHVKESHGIRIEWVEWNESGQFDAEDVPGSEEFCPAQLVLLAMGFLGPGAARCSSSSASSTTRGPTPRRSYGKFATSVPKVFAAGDCAAARAWWSGRSTKAAARPASATGT